MRDPAEALDQIRRIRRALEALSADLDVIEQRPHLSLKRAAENLEHAGSHGIEDFIDHFAFAVRNGTMR